MGTSVLIFLLTVGIIFGFVQKNFLNFASFYCFFWGFIVFLANLKLFGMMNYSNLPFYLIVIGTISFLVGYLICEYSAFPHIIISKKNKNKKIYNDKVITIISFICIVFYCFELLRVIQLLRSGKNYYLVRRMYQGYDEESFFQNSFESYFSSYFAVPCAYILSSYIVVSFFDKHRNFKVFLEAIIAMTFYLVVSASRFILIQIIIGTVYYFFLLKKKLPKKVKRILKNSVIILAIMLLVLSNLRENRTSSGAKYNWTIWQSVYSYFSVSIPLMDTWVHSIIVSGYRAHGLVFFRPILSIFSLVILHPLGIESKNLNIAIKNINNVENFVQVFPAHSYNAFASIYYYFFLDFGYAGVVAGSFIFGYFCSSIFKKLQKEKTDRNLAYGLIVIQLIFKSMVRWELSSPSFFVSCLVTPFLFKEMKIGDEKYQK